MKYVAGYHVKMTPPKGLFLLIKVSSRIIAFEPYDFNGKSALTIKPTKFDSLVARAAFKNVPYDTPRN